jgi:hypothetical protein
MAAEHFYFAWIDEGEPFNPAVHNRDDEDVFSFSIQQTEGDFASLSLDVKNPRIGLLNAGRKVWCYFSFDDGLGTIINLFKGRLIGIPSNIFDTVVTFSFIARPSDYVTQKHVLADTLRVLPYWDPILLSPDSWQDDDTVLEARSALWNVDRATHAMTISDVLVPEDGVMEFQPTDYFYDGMAMSLQETPLRSCNVTATFPWKNSGSGSLELGSMILGNWPGKDPLLDFIWSYTLPGLVSSWPKAGASIGSGWTVIDGSLTDVTFLNVQELKGVDLSLFDTSSIPGPIGKNSIMFPPKYAATQYGGIDGASLDETIDIVVALANWGLPVLSVGYSTSRDYSQVLQFTLTTDTQNIITDTGGDDVISINLTSNPLTDIGFDGGQAIAGSARTFLDTPRGQLALEHCILIARANLCIKSRAVQTTFETAFKTGAAVTCRKGCLIHDPRIPGGAAQGKVTAYKLSLDGNSGAAMANITIASAVGYGGAHTTSAGSPSWVEAAWVGSDWQQYNEVIKNLTGTSDITFEMPPTATFDDGVDLSRSLTRATAVKGLTVTNGPGVQANALNAALNTLPDQAAVNTLLHNLGTTIQLSLTPLMTGPFSGGVAPTLSKLIIPQQINLEAAST